MTREAEAPAASPTHPEATPGGVGRRPAAAEVRVAEARAGGAGGPGAAAEAGRAVSPLADLARRRVEAAGIREFTRLGAGARRRTTLTAVTTDALAAAWAQVGAPADGLALAAVGSLARGDGGPCSDLDLVLLHDGRASTERVGAVAERLWYPLWDCGVRLDHSVRTIDECRDVAAADLVAAVGLLDLRHVAGDPVLVSGARSTLAHDWRAQARTRLPELLEAVGERHARHGELADLLEPDLKEARGGLRDLTIIRSLAAAWLADRPHGPVDAAYERLLDVRDALHIATGRGRERLVAQERDSVAALLGHVSGDDLLREVSEAGRTIAYALEGTIRTAGQAQRARTLRVGPRRPTLTPMGHGLSEHDGEVVLGPRTDARRDPLLTLRAARAAARADLPLAPATVRNLAANVPRLPRPWPAAARDLFGDLLASGEGLTATWESLTLAGVVEAWIPAWSSIRSRPQHNPIHRHTVDRHSVQTVVEARRLLGDVRRPDLLLVAALLHDVGKAYGTEDHALLGVEPAREAARALGFDAAEAGVVALLVAQHLTLVELATRRDPQDPRTVELLCEAVGGDVDVLDLLRALTEADARAAGPGAWSPWRARLVDELTEGARAALDRGVAAETDGRPDVVDAPADLREAAVADGAAVVVEEHGAGHLVEVVAPDRVGLFADTAGLLAAAGATVRRARLSTVDGLAVDRWYVESPGGNAPDAAALRRSLVRLAAGDRRGLASLARRPVPGTTPRGASGPVGESRREDALRPAGDGPVTRALLVLGASDDATVLELRAADRFGLLHDVGRTLAAEGMSVRSAHVATYCGQAVDTVYVTGTDGTRPAPAAVARLVAALIEAADHGVPGE